MTRRLGPDTLPDLPPAVARPRYDREALGIGIVHIGLGAFHRAHQAVYTDDVLGHSGGVWGISGVSLRSTETRDALAPQGGLYTVGVRDEAALLGGVGRCGRELCCSTWLPELKPVSLQLA